MGSRAGFVMGSWLILTPEALGRGSETDVRACMGADALPYKNDINAHQLCTEVGCPHPHCENSSACDGNSGLCGIAPFLPTQHNTHRPPLSDTTHHTAESRCDHTLSFLSLNTCGRHSQESWGRDRILRITCLLYACGHAQSSMRSLCAHLFATKSISPQLSFAQW